MKKTVMIAAAVAVMMAVVLYADRRVSNSVATVEFKDFTDLKGKPIDIEPYKGKVVLINFWATYCKPCLTEIPWMNEFQEKYGPKGYVTFGINMDEEGAEYVKKWLAEPQIGIEGQPVKLAFNYPQFLGDSAVADAYGGLIGLPTTLLINREGKIVKRYIGISSKEKFEKAIEEVLQ